MHLIFATQELGKISRGVGIVLSLIFKGWPESDRVTLLLNHTHCPVGQLRHQLQGKMHIDFQLVPPWLLRDDQIHPASWPLPSVRISLCLLRDVFPSIPAAAATLKRRIIRRPLWLFKGMTRMLLPKRMFMRLIWGAGYVCLATYDSAHDLRP